MAIQKLIVIAIMIAIVYNMAKALRCLTKEDKNHSSYQYLSRRIGLSVGLFILLFVGYLFGIIAPHDIVPK